ncbi:MAG: sulfatase-like hydrolase/transferase [Bacteroidales bacterium]|nr:sulfatase-like hydrolase/transferase [Bacteroidales bacterium]
MKGKLLFLLRQVVFWYGFFVLSKILFLLFNLQTAAAFIKWWPAVFYHGFKLDFSTIGYILVLPSLLLAISGLIKGKWPIFATQYYSYFLLAILSFFIVADMAIYREWGFRLDATPLIYLKNIRDALASTPKWQMILMLLAVAVLTVIFSSAFRKIVLPVKVNSSKKQWHNFPLFVFITAALIIPIRGGFDTAPINTGAVYFHKEPFLNHAALNLPWNIIYSVTKSKDMVNPYSFYQGASSAEIIDNYRYSGKTGEFVLNNKRPDILLIVLESFTSDVVGCLNDKHDATPNLNSFAKNGLLFTRFFASGVRSDKGLAAILSAYPALPNTSVMLFPEKTQQLPGLARTFNEAGYSTSFYYGGDINFASMKSYMINIGFQKIISKGDFAASQNVMSWGVADEFLFDKVYDDIVNTKSPYFKTVFTLASHPPYDIPAKPRKPGNDRETQFINSVFYADSCLGSFVHRLEEDGRLQNTLIIFVADHGNLLPGNKSYSSIGHFQIPMIWYGGALTKTGKVQKIASQTDIAATLLEQLEINPGPYIFSRNVFGLEFRPEAMYAFNNGFGYLNDTLNFSYYQGSNQVEKVKGTINEETVMPAKLFFQAIYDNFLNLK